MWPPTGWWGNWYALGDLGCLRGAQHSSLLTTERSRNSSGCYGRRAVPRLRIIGKTPPSEKLDHRVVEAVSLGMRPLACITSKADLIVGPTHSRARTDN